jgi:hypothetical protein
MISNSSLRNIQQQLEILIQAHPDQIRSRGHATKKRRRLLHECRKDQFPSKAKKSWQHDPPASNERDGEIRPTTTCETEIEPVVSHSPASDLEFCPWLEFGVDPGWDSILLSLDGRAPTGYGVDRST